MKTLRETVQPLLKLFKGLKMEKIKIIYLLDLGIRKIHAKVMSIALGVWLESLDFRHTDKC